MTEVHLSVNCICDQDGDPVGKVVQGNMVNIGSVHHISSPHMVSSQQ